MYVYKITNLLNDKVYIGATKRRLHDRWNDHMKRRFKFPERKLYAAINADGPENFKMEQLYETDSFDELYAVEAEQIALHNSVENGYNTLSAAPQHEDWEELYSSFQRIMHSDDVRHRISRSMKQYRAEHPFTAEHIKKLGDAQRGRKMSPERALLCATRNIPCYCIYHGERYDFKNYKDAGIWWFNTCHPFGDKYSQATYQRKIIDCIDVGQCRVKRHGEPEIIITKSDIEWYRV